MTQRRPSPGQKMAFHRGNLRFLEMSYVLLMYRERTSVHTDVQLVMDMAMILFVLALLAYRVSIISLPRSVVSPFWMFLYCH